MQQLAQVKTGDETLSNLATEAKTSASISNEQFKELLRLRGEVGMLRQQTNELASLRSENEKLRSPELVQVESASQLSPEDQFTVRRTHIVNTESTLLRAIKNYAADHNGQFPGNFDELTGSGYFDDLAFRSQSRWKNQIGFRQVVAGNPKPRHTVSAWEDFEFLKPGIVDMKGRRTFFRYRTPIPHPPGDPVWIYGVYSENGRPITLIISTDFTKVDTGAIQASPSLNQ